MWTGPVVVEIECPCACTAALREEVVSEGDLCDGSRGEGIGAVEGGVVGGVEAEVLIIVDCDVEGRNAEEHAVGSSVTGQDVGKEGAGQIGVVGELDIAQLEDKLSCKVGLHWVVEKDTVLDEGDYYVLESNESHVYHSRTGNID